MITYVGLMDLLNHRGMKKTDLLEILSSKTIAKLSKDEYVSGEVIEKLCIFLKCQPEDIMAVIEMEENHLYLHTVDRTTQNWQSKTSEGILEENFKSWKNVNWIY